MTDEPIDITPRDLKLHGDFIRILRKTRTKLRNKIRRIEYDPTAEYLSGYVDTIDRWVKFLEGGD